MLTTELAKRQGQALTTIVGEDPFIFSPQLVNQLRLLPLARSIVLFANRVRPALPASPGGRPLTYQDESILVALWVMSLWQLSPESMVRRLKRWPELAAACGFAPARLSVRANCDGDGTIWASGRILWLSVFW